MLILAISSSALADLPVVIIDAASLPYTLSPNNYANSPSKFSNSISNFSNSASNFKNSPSNFANSPNNFKNTRSGSNRLLQVGRYVGYYAENGAGVINFFSASGKRALYNPEGTSAVFTSAGSFAGVLGMDGSRGMSLALTPDGLKSFLLK